MAESSPLAALYPLSIPFGHGPWNFGGGLSQARSRPSYSLGEGFNFKDMSMQKKPLDYFNIRPVRGHSPTASLSLEMSQNLCIGQRFVRGGSSLAIVLDANVPQPLASHASAVAVQLRHLRTGPGQR
jgi:hypothetical protein